MEKGDESTTPAIQTDESGKQEASAETLKKEIETLRAERDKLEAIKQKLVDEQQSKNRKHAELKGKEAGMEAQLKELQDKHLDVLTRLEEQEKERTSLKEYVSREETKKQAELEALKASIPDEKKSLIVESLPVDAQLEFIKKNSVFLLGTQNSNVFPLPVHKPKGSEQTVTLASEELAILGNMPEDIALDIKRRDPSFFQKFLKKSN